MIETAEIVADRYKVSREAQDEYALQSQRRTAEAQAAGRFNAEIVPLPSTMVFQDKDSGAVTKSDVNLAKDEGNRADTTLARPRRAEAGVPERPARQGRQVHHRRQRVAAFRRRLGRGADGSEGSGEARPAKPLGRYVGMAAAGCSPDEMGIGPVFAVPKLLQKHGLKIDDIDLWELNEAFACQVIYCRDRLGIPERQAQCRRRRDLHRPSLRHVGRAHGRACADRGEAPRRQARRRHHVRRRRHGRGRPVRGAVTCRPATA